MILEFASSNQHICKAQSHRLCECAILISYCCESGASFKIGVAGSMFVSCKCNALVQESCLLSLI